MISASGSATPPVEAELRERARQAGLQHFTITGYTSDEQYRDYAMAVDVGVQLRVSPFLGVSGPLSDMAACGTSAMGSYGLTVDVDTPPFIDRLPDEVSPLMVAEALEYRLAHPVPAEEREARVKDFVRRLRWKGPVFAVSALAREGLDGLVRAAYQHVAAMRRLASEAPDVRFVAALADGTAAVAASSSSASGPDSVRTERSRS